MTDPPLGDDGFLVMEAFSDADIDDPEIASVGYADPEPMSDSAWARAVASAVVGEQAPVDGDDVFGFDGPEPLPAHDDGDLDEGDDGDDVLDGWDPADGADGGNGADHADAAADDAPTGET